MWPQTYTPLASSLPLSALVAALPLFALLFLLGVARKPAWMAALAGLGAAAVVALFVYRMPPALVLSSALYGAAQGLLPIGWIVFTAILLYRLTVETGQFEIIKDSIGSLTGDQRLQALLIAFAFGAFIEGAAGFGTPVAVAAAMLTGLGFSPFYAAGICLLANTSPVAFGSIGTPLVMLQTVTGLPMADLSSNVGRICAPVSLFVPAYLVLVMGGVRALRAVLPAAAVCGIAFASAQFLVSNYLGPSLTDILGSLAAIGGLIILLRVWRPQGVHETTPHRHSTRQLIVSTAKQLALPLVTIASVLGLAFLMNYCGATATLGMAFSATGAAFPMFSALLGWLGVFLTGSDTSANALFGNLQVVTATQLHFNPALMAAANSSGGVMGKMISLQSIAVAAAATGMPHDDEAKLFRFTMRHSGFLAIVIGLVTLFYAYVMPGWARG